MFDFGGYVEGLVLDQYKSCALDGDAEDDLADEWGEDFSTDETGCWSFPGEDWVGACPAHEYCYGEDEEEVDEEVLEVA